eukprot:Rmarinus@m.8007
MVETESRNEIALHSLETRVTGSTQSFTRLVSRVGQDVRERIIVAGESQVKFDVKRFLKDWVAHFFWPLSYPLVLYWFGKNGKLNRDLKVFSRNFNNFMQLMQFPVLLMVDCMLLFMADEVKHVFVLEVFIAHIAVMFRASVIAIKYAIMPEPFHEQIAMRRLSKHFLHREQLILGWIRPDILTVEREVESAAAAMDVNLDETSVFVGCPVLRQWIRDKISEGDRDLKQSFLREGGLSGAGYESGVRSVLVEMADTGLWTRRMSVVSGAAGNAHCSANGGSALPFTPPTPSADVSNQCVTCKELLLAILLSSASGLPTTKQIYLGSMALAGVVGVSPMVARVLDGTSPTGDSMAASMSILMIAMIVLPGTATLTSFMATGCLDYYRRAQSLRILTSMVSPEGQNINLKSSVDGRGFLSLRLVNNVAAFTLARKMLLAFGKRYLWRVQLYCTTFVALSAVFFTLTFVAAFFSTDFFEGGELLLVVVLATMSAFMLGMCMVMAYFGGLANEQQLQDRACFHAEQMAISWEINTLPPEDKDKAMELRNIDHMLARASQSIKLDALCQPVKFMGFEASAALARTIGVAFVSAVSFTAELVLGM